MQIRQAKSTLLIFTYIFTMFLLPTISFHVLSLFFTNILDIQVYANLISYIILVVVSVLLFGHELMDQFKKIPSKKPFIKGVLTGWVLLFATKRTFKKAIQAICEDFTNKGVNEEYKIYISHACDEELALSAKEMIEKQIANTEIEVILLTPVFTTQGGPGCIAIQAIKKHEILK